MACELLNDECPFVYHAVRCIDITQVKDESLRRSAAIGLDPAI